MTVILSTGMATLREVEEALSVLAFGYASRHEPPIALRLCRGVGRPGMTRAHY